MSTDREPGMWQQFRHRRVTRTVVAYLAVAFAAVEAAWLLIPYLELPEWAGRVVLGTVVIGFPFAVVLAWTYDLTPRGIVKTPDDLGSEAPEAPRPRAGKAWWWVLTAGAVLVGLVLHFVHS